MNKKNSLLNFKNAVIALFLLSLLGSAMVVSVYTIPGLNKIAIVGLVVFAITLGIVFVFGSAFHYIRQSISKKKIKYEETITYTTIAVDLYLVLRVFILFSL